jgi:Icc-related predicted phosphoesterase
MLLVADVHGAAAALRTVAARGEPLLVLGDLINFIDYRSNDGILAEVAGRELVDELVRLRTSGDFAGASQVWRRFADGRERDVRQLFDEQVTSAYTEVCGALEGAEAYVTFGNVDRPDLLREMLPTTSRFVDAEVVEIEGLKVGFAGGGAPSLGTPGEVSEEQMATKLNDLGPLDILCTHVAPAITPLAKDVIGGREKSSHVLLDYLERHQPRYHYFGDIHQPQAVVWRVGRTTCRNVGYFRATGRPVRHEPEVSQPQRHR